MQIYIILFSALCIETLLLLFTFIKVPMPFIISAFFKRDLLYCVGKEKKGRFRLFKKQFGSAVVRNVGVYELTENSHTLEITNRIPIFFAFEDFAATMKLEYPAIIQELRESGYKINRIEDLENLITAIKAGEREQIKIDIKAFKTYNLTDLENMYPLNISPTFVDTQVQGELNKFSKLMKATPFLVGSLVVLLIVAAIAVLIIERAYKGQIGADTCEKMIDAVRCGATVAQTALNTNPIV